MKPLQPGPDDSGRWPLSDKSAADKVAALYDRYAATVLGLALRILGDRNEAEEVLEEVFLYVWEHGHELEENRASVATWLLGTTRERCLARLRQRPSAPAPQPLAQSFEGGAGGEGGEEQRARRVREALDSLPPEQRQVIELLYFEGLSRREVAVRLGYPDETVLAYARLGLQKLQEALLTPSQGLNDANE